MLYLSNLVKSILWSMATIEKYIVAMATILAFCIWGVHWRHMTNTTEPSVSGGDVALCQSTLTTCLIYFPNEK